MYHLTKTSNFVDLLLSVRAEPSKNPGLLGEVVEERQQLTFLLDLKVHVSHNLAFGHARRTFLYAPRTALRTRSGVDAALGAEGSQPRFGP